HVSLLQDAKGKWRIAPAYDLIGTVVLGYDSRLAFSIGYQNNAMQLLSRDWKLLAEQSQLSYPFIKREIKRLRELLLRFADSKEMQQALKDAGLPDNAWLRLQQQRHHIVKQCKKAALW
ncbi:HipA domain-containing protein, partial [Vreelandella aquamarina]